VNPRVGELLATSSGRGRLKQLAAELDRDPDLREALLAAARARGVDLPDDARGWPGKKLLRAARDRSAAAQIVSTPTARDEAFTCDRCGYDVPAHGRTARDHCPRCLWSRHVDRIPGDRAETCRGLLEPVGVSRRGRGYDLHYRCVACGAPRVNQALLDGDEPDSWDAVVALSVART
jgi:hypothetical protein